MPRAHILLVEGIHETAHERFARAEVAARRVERGLDETDLIGALNEFPAPEPVFLGIRSKTRVTRRVIEAVPRLDAIGAFCIGTDQIDLEAARARGIAVFNAPFSSTRSVAELVLGEIVMLSRQIFARSTAAHEGRWAKSATGAREVRGKTLGIVGYGHIGSQLSILAESFGMRVLYYDIVTKLPLGNAVAVPTLDDLLRESDFVSLHVPDTELTRGMIGPTEIETMAAGAFLINASRGQVVDLGALRSALVAGHIGGAAVDVFPVEPRSRDERFVSPLQGLENVILSPHIGGSTQEAQANIGYEVSGSLVRYLESGYTVGSVTLPELDAPCPEGSSRIVDVHRNVPGVLSSTNRIVAELGVNIVGQHLKTLEDVGLLYVDVALRRGDPLAQKLYASIAGLPTSIRTRLV